MFAYSVYLFFLSLSEQKRTIKPKITFQTAHVMFQGRQVKGRTRWVCGECGGCCRAVPAEIVEEWSSDDVTVQEGDSVWLHCNVTGVPPPTVTWHRRTTSGRGIHECRQRTVDAGMRSLPIITELLQNSNTVNNKKHLMFLSHLL